MKWSITSQRPGDVDGDGGFI
eukprot:SAG25_NODE_15522_length_109_cov_46.900000_1_plen_20_part_10